MARKISKEEEYTEDWIKELVDVGMIDKYTCQPSPYFLLDCPLVNDYTEVVVEELKTKTKEVIKKRKEHLIKEHKYTADFEIHWNEKAKGVFYSELSNILLDNKKMDTYFVAQNGISVLEVKGNHDMNNMTRLAKVNIGWVYEAFGEYVQLVIPWPKILNGKEYPKNSLFTNTFMPESYLLTNTRKQKRKINFKFQLINEFIDNERFRKDEVI